LAGVTASATFFPPPQATVGASLSIQPAHSLSSTSTLFMASVLGEGDVTAIRVWSLSGVPGVSAVSGTVIVALSSPPPIARLGGSFLVRDTVRNIGTGGGGPSRTRYYLSADLQKNFGDKLLTGSRVVPLLDPARQSSATVRLSSPQAPDWGGTSCWPARTTQARSVRATSATTAAPLPPRS
jgi:hypothetical protein